jgi:hypothetical protein
MRLSGWRSSAPTRAAMGPKVLAVVEPVLAALGSDKDPEAWVAWGDDPAARWTILVPAAAGLIVGHVRVDVPGEGPRIAAKLVRWSRVQLGELAIETQGGHRIGSFQVEGQVMRGPDDAADAIAAFAIRLFAGVDGRPVPDAVALPRRRSRGTGTTKTAPEPPTRRGSRMGAQGGSRPSRSPRP